MSYFAPAHSLPDAIGLSTVNGLPAHILIVHAVVVFVPLSAIALIAAIRPVWARRLGIALPAVAIAALLSVLAAMNSGGWLQNHVQNTALVRDHTRIAGQLWPFSAVVALLSVVVWRLSSRPTTSSRSTTRRGWQSGRISTAVIIGVLSVAVGVGSIVEVVRIGDTGAHAAWHNHFTVSN
jgi:hypothetical protein